jgi:hypothetical protein
VTTKSRAALIAEFTSAIEALGGHVQPMLVHDDPLRIDVPAGAQRRAEALFRKLQVDLGVKANVTVEGLGKRLVAVGKRLAKPDHTDLLRLADCVVENLRAQYDRANVDDRCVMEDAATVIVALAKVVRS